MLQDLGAARLAVRQARSLRAVTRCQGAFTLGVLRSDAELPRLTALLDDRAHEVRRVAARALGHVGDPAATTALLTLAGRDAGLARDAAYALSRIGLPAAPLLRDHMIEDLRSEDDRLAVLVAGVLGTIGDLDAAPVLTRVLAEGQPRSAAAAAEALGQLELPTHVPELVVALEHADPDVRRAAAEALGRLGVEAAVPALVAAVEAGDPACSRAAAQALRAVGPAGLAALRASTAPHAREAIALVDLGAVR
jgi:HEAT repeat protein